MKTLQELKHIIEKMNKNNQLHILNICDNKRCKIKLNKLKTKQIAMKIMPAPKLLNSAKSVDDSSAKFQQKKTTKKKKISLKNLIKMKTKIYQRRMLMRKIRRLTLNLITY